MVGLILFRWLQYLNAGMWKPAAYGFLFRDVALDFGTVRFNDYPLFFLYELTTHYSITCMHTIDVNMRWGCMDLKASIPVSRLLPNHKQESRAPQVQYWTMSEVWLVFNCLYDKMNFPHKYEFWYVVSK